jgi:exopolysaccharide biosynthesis WecB/TagA/CpsF family protein
MHAVVKNSALRKCAIFGVHVSPTTYAQAVDHAIKLAKQGVGGIFDFMSAHGLIMGARDEKFRRMSNSFDVVAPDGQPVRWLLNRLYGANLPERCYGPELTIRLCAAAAENGIGIYLYGSSEEVIAKLQANLLAKYPTLKIVGAESPPFRPLTPEEDAAVVKRINDSGAGILFIGTGCPKQEVFAYEHRDSIHAVQMCVGAAFDFHAGVKKMAPRWMQKAGLEWFFRLLCEPRRLWKRYLINNTTLTYLVIRELIRRRKGAVGVHEELLAEA